MGYRLMSKEMAEEDWKMEDKYEQHKELCNSLNELYISKNKEYGDSFGKAYRDLGMISAIAQIYHKTQRLTQIYDKDEIEHESLENNLIDLANYSLMALLEMKRDAK